MPTLRIMRDGRPSYATAGQPDTFGVPSWAVGGGNTELLALDFTAWLGTATLAEVTWDVSAGQLGTPTTSGAVASVPVVVPVNPTVPPSLSGYIVPGVTVSNVAQASDGRVLRQLLRLYPQPASIGA